MGKLCLYCGKDLGNSAPNRKACYECQEKRNNISMKNHYRSVNGLPLIPQLEPKFFPKKNMVSDGEGKYKITCCTCGKEFMDNSDHRRYCDECREKRISIRRKNRYLRQTGRPELDLPEEKYSDTYEEVKHGTSKSINECYENFAAFLAAMYYNDYRRALETGNKRRSNELERLFKTSWFEILSAVDPEYVVNRIRKEVLK